MPCSPGRSPVDKIKKDREYFGPLRRIRATPQACLQACMTFRARALSSFPSKTSKWPRILRIFLPCLGFQRCSWGHCAGKRENFQGLAAPKPAKKKFYLEYRGRGMPKKAPKVSRAFQTWRKFEGHFSSFHT